MENSEQNTSPSPSDSDALTWRDVTLRSAALGDIIAILDDYLPGAADPNATLGKIIRIIETKTGRQFIAGASYGKD